MNLDRTFEVLCFYGRFLNRYQYEKVYTRKQGCYPKKKQSADQTIPASSCNTPMTWLLAVVSASFWRHALVQVLKRKRFWQNSMSQPSHIIDFSGVGQDVLPGVSLDPAGPSPAS